MKRVLIAHQSTIPHYRIDFYNALEELRPDSWSFKVVFDPGELQKKLFFKEDINTESFNFPTLKTKTYAIKIGEKVFNLQTFFKKAPDFDLIIVGSALSNITYPLCLLFKPAQQKYAVWGHGKDRTVSKPSRFKKMLEVFRSGGSKRADGFFAYTEDIKTYLESKGVVTEKIFVLNNTIDILKQRNIYEKLFPDKEHLKHKMGLNDKKVLLFVGRFTKNKRIDFLLESFIHLTGFANDYHLIMVGSGSEKYRAKMPSNITFFDSITDINILAPLYIASDIFAFPGDVGLGPLQALCYNLPVITLDSPTHMPEIIYLNNNNSLILPFLTTSFQYAETIHKLFSNPDELANLKSNIWSSINHLTIEQMAKNFIAGVNTILEMS